MKMTAEQAMGLAWCITQQGEDVMLRQLDHWLEVDFFTNGIVYCIWDTTGSVYETESLGGGHLNAVKDDPIYTPSPFAKVTMPNAKLVSIMNEIADERDALKARLESLGERV